MGSGRSGIPKGVKNTTDRTLEKLFGKSMFMKDIHSAQPGHRGINSAINANPGNFIGSDVEPDLLDFMVKREDGSRHIDFKAYDEAHDQWEKLYKNKQDTYYNDLTSFQINCQRCVIAWEVNYRGYDVEARPNPKDNNDGFNLAYNENNFLSTFRNKDGSRVQPLYHQEYYDLPGYLHKSKGEIGKMFRTQITNTMLKEGNGARFVIDFGRRSSVSGHTFTAEVVGNKIKVYEPQYARSSSLVHYINGDTSRVRVTRVDNAYLDSAKLKVAVIAHRNRRHKDHGGTYTSRK